MRPSKEELQKRERALAYSVARSIMRFVSKQYRSGMPGAYIDDISKAQADAAYPYVVKALKTLGYPHTIMLSHACILIDFV